MTQHTSPWLRSIALLAVCSVAVGADATFPPAPQWGNLGPVDIVPCPKRIKALLRPGLRAPWRARPRFSTGALDTLLTGWGCL